MKGRLIDTGRARYVAGLKGLLQRYANHPVAPDVLVALGEVHEDSAGKAIRYYTQAARHAAGDRWAFAQQRALQRLARVHEGQGQYRKAVEVLRTWRISEPCGTGAAHSSVRKEFMIWRLRSRYENWDEVHAEMWAAVRGHLERTSMVSGRGLAQLVRSFYGDGEEDLARLEREVGKLAGGKPGGAAQGAREKLRRQQTEELVTTLREGVALERRTRAASMKELLELVTDPASRAGGGDLRRLFDPFPPEGYPPSHAKRLLDALVRKGREALPGLMEVGRKRHNGLAVAAIGRIGGGEAVRYLSEMAAAQARRALSADYYFALLLTEDKEAHASVERSAAADEHAKRAREAYSSSALLARIIGAAEKAGASSRRE
jgi:hypothetical protein